MLLVESGFKSELVSLIRRICIENCILVLKQVVLIVRVVFILSGLYSEILQYHGVPYTLQTYNTLVHSAVYLLIYFLGKKGLLN